MVIEITTRNVLICAPNALLPQQTLAVRGNFLVHLHFYNPLSAADISQEVLDNKLTHHDAWDLNMQSHFNITLGHLEIFICDLQELVRVRDFKLVRKRPVLHPVNVLLFLKKYLVINEELNAFSTRSVINAEVEQTSLRISARDIALFQSTLASLTSGLAGDSDDPKKVPGGMGWGLS